MVPVRRHAGHWRTYLAGGGVVLAALSVSAAQKIGQPETAQANTHPASNQTNGEQPTSRPETLVPPPPNPAAERPPAIIEVEPSAKSIEAVSQEKAAETHVLGLEPDAWVALFTLLLTLSTTALWLETARLRSGADRQQAADKTARDREMAEMTKSIAQATRAAEAMERLAEATRIHANTASDAVAAAGQQAEETRQQQIRMHRPRIRVRYFIADNGGVQPGSHLSYSFEITNVGGVRAHVIASHCEVDDTGPRANRPYDRGALDSPIIGSPTIAAGETITCSLMSDRPPRQTHLNFVITFRIFGFIDYIDDLAIKLRTAFCREWHQGTRSFVVVKNNDFDYKD